MMQPLVAPIVILAAWAIASQLELFPTYIVPSLPLVLGAFRDLVQSGEIFHYIVGISLANITTVFIASAVAILVGRVALRTWLRSTAPVQVAAFATQSSLACLPAMVERLRDDLDVPDRITGLVLPLAVALFRMTGPVANYGVVLFLLRVYGVHPSVAQLAGGTFVAVATSLASVSLPGQLSFFASIAPICLAMGIPVDILPILIAVEVIPDIFRTIGNVTADMAITVILWRSETRTTASEAAAA